ncbi:hypothetical protein HYH02_012554 [Chlamydomonas schloesseri]|uniref:Pherophorin domain-containing protein n=1 Tax=Chlamydomonas schloesseri TaxID=2026947 RepID=A0A835T8P9_9CHLO|nr:hypothetical protein HYH02_012554 [Chlamydomonas schloesseri]|eukprot:KAG2433625.1 hypothetical protein HYH02_012554 [Chlamydomonas schloesseri]
MVSPLGTARRGLPVHAVLAVLLCVALPVAFGAYDTTFPFGRCSSGPSPYRVEPIVTQPQQQQGGKAGATAGARTFCFKLLARRPTQGSCSDYCCKEAGVHKLEINVKPQCYVSGDVVSATLNGKPTKAAAGLRRTTNTPPGMNATVLAVTQLGLPGIAAVDGAQVCITLATNKDRRGCTTLEDLCVPPAGQPAGTCAVALFDATIRCCPTSSARLLAGSRPGTSAAPSPPPRPPPPPSPRTNCPPKAGYTLLVDTNWEGLPGWKGGQEASGEAAHKLCDADPQCGHWNNWGYWFNGAAKSYFEYGGLCSYVKNGKEMYNTRVSNFFCGEAAAAVGTYITTSDAPLAALMPPAAIAGRAGFILEQRYAYDAWTLKMPPREPPKPLGKIRPLTALFPGKDGVVAADQEPVDIVPAKNGVGRPRKRPRVEDTADVAAVQPAPQPAAAAPTDRGEEAQQGAAPQPELELEPELDSEDNEDSDSCSDSDGNVEIVESPGRKRKRNARKAAKPRDHKAENQRRRYVPAWTIRFSWSMALAGGARVGCSVCKLLNKHVDLFPHNRQLKQHQKSPAHVEAVAQEQEELAKKARLRDKLERMQEMLKKMQDEFDRKKVTQLAQIVHLLLLGRPMTDFEATHELMQVLKVPDIPARHWNDNAAWLLAEALEEAVLDMLRERVKKAEFIGISLDEATDVSNKSWMCVHVYFMDGWHREAAFVDLVELTEAPDAKYLARVLLSTLRARLGLSARDLARMVVGIGADGAGVMAGEHSGVLRRMTDGATPYAITIWCMAHRGNLAAKKLSGTPVVAKIESLVAAAHSFHSTSAKRQAAFAQYAEAAGTKGNQLKEAGDTRWLSLQPAVSTLVAEHVAVALQAVHDADADRSDLRAHGLSAQLLDLEALLGMHALLPLMEPLQIFLKQCQATSAFVGDLVDALSRTKRIIEERYTNSATAFTGDAFDSYHAFLGVGSKPSPLLWDEEDGCLGIKVDGEWLELTAVRPRVPGAKGRPCRQPKPVSPDVLAEVTQSVQRQLKEAAEEVVADLTRRFPPVPVLDALSLAYPQYWAGSIGLDGKRTAPAKADVDAKLDTLERYFGGSKPAPSDITYIEAPAPAGPNVAAATAARGAAAAAGLGAAATAAGDAAAAAAPNAAAATAAGGGAAVAGPDAAAPPTGGGAGVPAAGGLLAPAPATAPSIDTSPLPPLLDIAKLRSQKVLFAPEAHEQAVCVLEAQETGLKLPKGSFVAFWQSMTRSAYQLDTYGEFARLAKLAATIVPGSVEAERVFSTMSYIKNKQRNRLEQRHLSLAVRMKVQRWFTVADFPYSKALAAWRDNAAFRWE